MFYNFRKLIDNVVDIATNLYAIKRKIEISNAQNKVTNMYLKKIYEKLYEEELKEPIDDSEYEDYTDINGNLSLDLYLKKIEKEKEEKEQLRKRGVIIDD